MEFYYEGYGMVRYVEVWFARVYIVPPNSVIRKIKGGAQLKVNAVLMRELKLTSNSSASAVYSFRSLANDVLFLLISLHSEYVEFTHGS